MDALEAWAYSCGNQERSNAPQGSGGLNGSPSAQTSSHRHQKGYSFHISSEHISANLSVRSFGGHPSLLALPDSSVKAAPRPLPGETNGCPLPFFGTRHGSHLKNSDEKLAASSDTVWGSTDSERRVDRRANAKPNATGWISAAGIESSSMYNAGGAKAFSVWARNGPGAWPTSQRPPQHIGQAGMAASARHGAVQHFRTEPTGRLAHGSHIQPISQRESSIAVAQTDLLRLEQQNGRDGSHQPPEQNSNGAGGKQQTGRAPEADDTEPRMQRDDMDILRHLTIPLCQESTENVQGPGTGVIFSTQTGAMPAKIAAHSKTMSLRDDAEKVAFAQENKRSEASEVPMAIYSDTADHHERVPGEEDALHMGSGIVLSLDSEGLVPCKTCNNDVRVDPNAAREWIYPADIPEREYQLKAIQGALLQNALICLPTGLGKTLIAAVVMHNFARWFPKSKIVFVAPTRPLVAQQINACRRAMGMEGKTCLELTGRTKADVRKDHWRSSETRIYFCTPQTFWNDVKRGICPYEELTCVVVDECHRAVGQADVAQAVRFMRNEKHLKFRVVGLSATPGSNVNQIQDVITNLGIGFVFFRSDDDDDVKSYVHGKHIDVCVVPADPEGVTVRSALLNSLQQIVGNLCTSGLYHGTADAERISRYSLLKAQKLLPPGTGFLHREWFRQAMVLADLRDQLENHGVHAALSYVTTKLIEEKCMQKLHAKDPVFALFVTSLQKVCRSGGEGPRMRKLAEILRAQFEHNFHGDDSMPCEPATESGRVMIFASLREDVSGIIEALRQYHPMIRARAFVGQGGSASGASRSSSGPGMKQAEQKEVLKGFRDGSYNVLVCTCIGEEGLDIPEVDLIICFDATASPTRAVQRHGRTGRHKEGRVIYIVSSGKEEEHYYALQRNAEALHAQLRDAPRYFDMAHGVNNPRMLPRQFHPVRSDKVLGNSSPKERYGQSLDGKSSKYQMHEQVDSDRKLNRRSSTKQTTRRNRNAGDDRARGYDTRIPSENEMHQKADGNLLRRLLQKTTDLAPRSPVPSQSSPVSMGHSPPTLLFSSSRTLIRQQGYKFSIQPPSKHLTILDPDEREPGDGHPGGKPMIVISEGDCVVVRPKFSKKEKALVLPSGNLVKIDSSGGNFNPGNDDQAEGSCKLSRWKNLVAGVAIFPEDTPKKSRKRASKRPTRSSKQCKLNGDGASKSLQRFDTDKNREECGGMDSTKDDRSSTKIEERSCVRKGMETDGNHNSGHLKDAVPQSVNDLPDAEEKPDKQQERQQHDPPCKAYNPKQSIDKSVETLPLSHRLLEFKLEMGSKEVHSASTMKKASTTATQAIGPLQRPSDSPSVQMFIDQKFVLEDVPLGQRLNQWGLEVNITHADRNLGVSDKENRDYEAPASLKGSQGAIRPSDSPSGQRDQEKRGQADRETENVQEFWEEYFDLIDMHAVLDLEADWCPQDATDLAMERKGSVRHSFMPEVEDTRSAELVGVHEDQKGTQNKDNVLGTARKVSSLEQKDDSTPVVPARMMGKGNVNNRHIIMDSPDTDEVGLQEHSLKSTPHWSQSMTPHISPKKNDDEAHVTLQMSSCPLKRHRSVVGRSVPRKRKGLQARKAASAFLDMEAVLSGDVDEDEKHCDGDLDSYESDFIDDGTQRDTTDLEWSGKGAASTSKISQGVRRACDKVGIESPGALEFLRRIRRLHKGGRQNMSGEMAKIPNYDKTPLGGYIGTESRQTPDEYDREDSFIADSDGEEEGNSAWGIFGEGGSVDTHDDHCQICGAAVGELLLCDGPGCRTSMHLGCIGLTSVPVGDWYCPTCHSTV